jgi:uncharacterized protein YwgA
MLEDHAKIAALIDQAGVMPGRKKLQKIVYILQKLGFPFYETYHFQFYGPYSDELSMQLEELCDFGFVLEEGRSGSGSTPGYRLSEAGKGFLYHYKHILPDVKDDVEKLVSERTDFLELVSTLLYFDHLPRKRAAEKARTVIGASGPEEVNCAYTYISELYAECQVSSQASGLTGHSF